MNVIMMGANNPEVVRLIRDWHVATVSGFIDNDKSLWGKMFYGYPIFGGFAVLPQLIKDFSFVNLVTGSTASRHSVFHHIKNEGGLFCNFIHPSVNRELVALGRGIYIQDHVVVQAGAYLDDNVAIHTGAIISHECKIGAHSFIAHGACLSGKVEVGEGVFVGANATILPRLKIGKWSTIGAGAVVTKDVAEYSVVAGNPARELIK